MPRRSPNAPTLLPVGFEVRASVADYCLGGRGGGNRTCYDCWEDVRRRSRTPGTLRPRSPGRTFGTPTAELMERASNASALDGRRGRRCHTHVRPGWPARRANKGRRGRPQGPACCARCRSACSRRADPVIARQRRGRPCRSAAAHHRRHLPGRRRTVLTAGREWTCHRVGLGWTTRFTGNGRWVAAGAGLIPEWPRDGERLDPPRCRPIKASRTRTWSSPGSNRVGVPVAGRRCGGQHALLLVMTARPHRSWRAATRNGDLVTPAYVRIPNRAWLSTCQRWRGPGVRGDPQGPCDVPPASGDPRDWLEGPVPVSDGDGRAPAKAAIAHVGDLGGRLWPDPKAWRA